MDSSTHKGRNRIEWVLVAKGIAILLVVIGHYNPDSAPAYWTALNAVIYSFHMPLFFLLSGYLYSRGSYAYPNLIRRKTRRLLYPFIAIAAAALFVKFAAGRFVALDHPVTVRSILALFTDPVSSFMPLLWFIYTLFFIFALYPLLRMLLSAPLILAALLIVNTLFGTGYPVLGRVAAYMPFFVCGVLLKEHPRVLRTVLHADRRLVCLQAAVFLALYVLLRRISMAPVFEYAAWFALAVLGAALVLSAGSVLAASAGGKAKRLWMGLGYYSMTIYLLHPLFASPVRIAFSQDFRQGSVLFLPIALLAIACGVLLPLVIENIFLRKFRITRQFVLGLH